MVGRQVCVLDEVTVASPAYLARHGTPQGLDDLDGHQVVGFVSTATGAVMPLEFTIEGMVRELRLPATVTVVGAETYAAACELGLGLAQMPRYHVAGALAAGSLVEVLPRFPPSPTPVSVLYPHSRQLSPRVRVFIDWITRRFAPP
jgi:DNA-binding transcriptional LysR family regulator